MKRMWRIMAGFMAAAMLLTLAACKDKTDDGVDDNNQITVPYTTRKNVPTDFKLSYSAEDSLNPFEAETLQNQALMPLLYESLFKLDGEYYAQPIVAENYTMDGDTVTVALRSIQFSDGTLISADDVVSSFNQAKESPAYGDNLAGVSSASAVSASSVRFTLSKSDLYVSQILTFPILKSGTDIGAGRYILKESGSSYILSHNSSWYGGGEPTFKEIPLVNIVDAGTVLYSLEIGNVDFVYKDLSDGAVQKINASTVACTQNNLVFVGFNQNRGPMSNASFRTGVSLAIDQTELASSGFQGFADAASVPYHPKWKSVSSLTTPGVQTDLAAAKAAFQKANLSYDESGTKLMNGASQVSLSILVNEENDMKMAAANLLQAQLRSAGISAAIEAVTYEQYLSRVKGLNYDIYIGEVKLTDNFDLSCFFSASGEARYGIFQSGETYQGYATFLAGEITLQQFLDIFSEDMPIVPICFRSGAVYYNRNLSVSVESVETDVFYNIFDWKY